MDNNVVFAKIEDGGIAQNVHIHGRAVLESILLGVAQGLARAKNIRFGLAHAVQCAFAVEKILGDGQSERPRVGPSSEPAPTSSTHSARTHPARTRATRHQ